MDHLMIYDCSEPVLIAFVCRFSPCRNLTELVVVDYLTLEQFSKQREIMACRVAEVEKGK